MADEPATRVAVGGPHPVLVIDDDPDARELLARTLEDDGHSVVMAATGEEGLRLAAEVSPALITLDIMMPSTDGWSVLNQLKADPELESIPVVMISLAADRGIGYAMGAVESLSKPVDRAALLKLVRQHRSEPGGRVLIVEDDDYSRSLMRRSLESGGWDITEARTGVEGLERLHDGIPDLILLDLMMPVMDGFEFVDALRKEDGCEMVPVIVVTAKDLTPSDLNRLHGSVDQIINKSGRTPGDLMEHLRALLATRS